MTTEEYLVARKRPDWKFNKVVDESSFQSVNRIHPIKQRQVAKIVDYAKNDMYIKRIIIFGSSTRYDCDETSDLDICVDWSEDCYDSDGVLKPFTVNMRKAIASATNGDSDVVNFDYLDDTVVKDAVNKGVVVYEHNV